MGGFALMLLFTYLPFVFSRTVTYNWDVSWVNASPDGFSRPVIGINGKWPCPPISVEIGDRVVVNLRNQQGNETTSLHFHGLFQTGSNTMDGPAGVTQCPIPPGEKFTYDFVVSLRRRTASNYTHRIEGSATGHLLVSLSQQRAVC